MILIYACADSTMLLLLLLHTAFARIDADNSGLLEKEEVRTLLQMCDSSGTAVTDAELESAMAQLDGDHSGEVDQEEFTKYFKEHRQEKGGVMAGMMALFAALQKEEEAAAAETKVTCIFTAIATAVRASPLSAGWVCTLPRAAGA